MDMPIGSLVEHPSWGRGKVLALRQPNAEAYFPSLTGDAGGPTRVVRLTSLSLSPVQSDPDLDQIDGKPKKSAARGAKPVKRPDHDLPKAVEWFEKEYPGRFADPRFVAEELTHKREAQKLFADRFGSGAGAQMLAAGSGAEIGNVLDTLWHHTSIPSRFEVMAAHDGLKDADASARLLEALLAMVEAPGSRTFTRLSDAVAAMPGPSDGSRIHTWPNVTLLPFFADPSRFIVAKPEITKLVAGRMGRDLHYTSAVRWDTYARVLDMSHALRDALAPLGAEDFIDVQSFIWVTRKLT